uniref:Aldehyde dehydrogenase family 3 member B1-like n=1 Tax=Echeneis naucrates TaxID=173247 RepID=A0A665TRQ6_ECHNA
MVQSASKCMDLLRRARVAFQAGRTLKESFRLSQLEAVVRMVEEHECDFVDALRKDLHKVRGMGSISTVVHKSTSLDDCVVISEPLGVVFIMGTWCSPIQMCLGPLVGAIAAGGANAFIYSFTFSSHKLRQDLTTDGVYLCRKLQKKILKMCFTFVECFLMLKDGCQSPGNREEGRRIAQAAARTFTPVTLILGGKNPCYVDQHCDIATTAQRVAWARFHNAGQSLVAPDYVLCHRDVKVRLVQALKCCLDIFGPILPILTVNSVDEAIAFINKQEKPLCVYAYSSNSKVISRLMSETSSGSFCSNDSVLQSLMVALPFGGVGASGVGSYHGHYSFDTFSHRKSCLLRSTRFETWQHLDRPPLTAQLEQH